MLTELSGVIDGVATFDAGGLGDDELCETVVELERLAARLDAAVTKVAAAWDARRAWEPDGARSGAAWLAWKCRGDPRVARRRLRLGRALRHLPEAEPAWSAGDITSSHVEVLARARTPVTAEAFERDEGRLVEAARTLRYDHFCRVVAYWSQCADPDGVEDQSQRRWQQRALYLSEGLDGVRFGQFRLDPLGGAAFANVLDQVETELFEADWAEARARLGEAATAEDLTRTPAQRRADALVELARRAATAPPDGRRPAPLFTVLVGYETLAGRICELADRTPVAPGSLLPWLDEAYVERVVFDGPRRVIDVGAHRRLFTGAVRRAIQIRDQGCYHPSCDADPDRCQVDHILPWGNDGPTTQDNGRLACAYHNRLRQRRPPPG